VSSGLDYDPTPLEPGEAERAAALAAALDGRPAPGVDAEALAAAYLLQTLATAHADDELAAARFERLERRLRADRLRRRFVHAAAAAALLVATGAGAWLALERRAPSPEQVAARELEARLAVSALVAARPAPAELGALQVARRQRQLYAAAASARYEALRRSLLESRSSDPLAAAPEPSPTLPGGRPS
jgi:hypothetical protein